MGVKTFLLDRRTATLRIGASKQTVRTLRRFFKLMELDESRAAEFDAAALATGVTDMRRGMNSLALQVSSALCRDTASG